MPYKSLAQAAYFNIHRKELEREGVDVDEWNDSTRGKKLPKKLKKKASLLDVDLLLKQASVDFKPDYTPDQLKEMGVYKEVYGKKEGPRLASLEAWPAHWYHPEDKKGWLEWYQKYNAGRRMEDDTRQINRWKAFKARHGGPAFQGNPTPRRAYALRNWGIDASKLVKDPESLQKVMEAYRAKKYEKAASDGLLKEATTMGATKALLRVLRSEGVQIHRTPEPVAAGMLENVRKTLSGMGTNMSPSDLKGMIKQQIEAAGPSYVGEANAIYLPRGKFVPGAARKPITLAASEGGKKVNFNPREVLFHEGGHATHYLEDPRIANLSQNASRGPVVNENTLSFERIANNNAINFMREQKVPVESIDNYIKNVGKGYKNYLRGYKMLDPSNLPTIIKMHPNSPKTSFSEIHKAPFSVDLPAGAKTGPVSFPAPVPASAPILKEATTMGATKALLRVLRSEGVQIHRTPEPVAAGMLENVRKTLSGMGTNMSPSDLKGMIKQQIEAAGPSYVPGEANAIYLPRGKFVPGAARKPITMAAGVDGKKVNFNPREVLFHEGGHATHYLEDPRIANLSQNASRGGVVNENTLSSERIANNNAINFMREQKVPVESIDNYIKNVGKGYKNYLRGYKMLAPSSSNPSPIIKMNPNFPKTSFSEIHKAPFSVDLPAGAKTGPVSFPAPVPASAPIMPVRPVPSLLNNNQFNNKFLKDFRIPSPGKPSDMFTPASKLKPLKGNGSLRAKKYNP